jgi:hypothetical protein
MRIKLLLTFIVLNISGCVSMAKLEPIVLKEKFNAIEAKELMQEGNNSIKGSALIRQAGGTVVTCAGTEITLIPATKYAKERMLNLYGNINNGFISINKRFASFTSTEPEYNSMQKNTVCDAQGFFKFDKVMSGEYFLITSIVWRLQQYQNAGGHLMKKINLIDGQNLETTLSH